MQQGNMMNIDAKTFIQVMENAKKNAKDSERWYTDILKWKWDSIRTPKSGSKNTTNCSWVDVDMTYNGRTGRPVITSVGEIQSGFIIPKNPEDLKKLNEKFKGAEKQERKGDPFLTIKKYKYMKTGSKPDPESISHFFRAMELYCEVFTQEIEYQRSKYKLITKEDARKNKAVKDSITLPSTSCSTPIQTHTSGNINRVSTTPPNTELSNPILRVKMPFSYANIQIYDKTKVFRSNGQVRYEKAKINGNDINDENIHMFIQPGCVMDIAVNIGSACCSATAVSPSVKLMVAVVAPPVSNENIGYDIIYGCMSEHNTPISTEMSTEQILFNETETESKEPDKEPEP